MNGATFAGDQIQIAEETLSNTSQRRLLSVSPIERESDPRLAPSNSSREAKTPRLRQGHTSLSYSSSGSCAALRGLDIGQQEKNLQPPALCANIDSENDNFSNADLSSVRFSKGTEISVSRQKQTSGGYRPRTSQNLERDVIIVKPWTENKSRRRADKRAYWLFLVNSFLGIVGAAALIATGYFSVPKHSYCLLLNEQFTGSSIDNQVWFHEQQTGGFGTGEFEWISDSPNNSYIEDGQLFIVPTLTSDALGLSAITDGYTLNLTAQGTCTSANLSDTYCAVSSNSSTETILPPVQSARLVTNFSTSLKYGRVEVRAKMPTGDWIWPAVWMMPKESIYGEWPRSGEIDIFESKGNIVTSKFSDGPNFMHSTLHWGPDAASDHYYKTSKSRRLYRDYFNEKFHTFGLDWTPEGIYTWEQSPIHKVLSYNFGRGFWEEGDFPTVSPNGSTYINPWPPSNVAAPFDQAFYLILSVAIGGTNGYFDEEDMPWSNDGGNAVNEFWKARDDWYPTWPQDLGQRAMIIDSVKIWAMDGVDGAQCPQSSS